MFYSRAYLRSRTFRARCTVLLFIWWMSNYFFLVATLRNRMITCFGWNTLSSNCLAVWLYLCALLWIILDLPAIQILRRLYHVWSSRNFYCVWDIRVFSYFRSKCIISRILIFWFISINSCLMLVWSFTYNLLAHFSICFCILCSFRNLLGIFFLFFFIFFE